MSRLVCPCGWYPAGRCDACARRARTGLVYARPLDDPGDALVRTLTAECSRKIDTEKALHEACLIQRAKELGVTYELGAARYESVHDPVKDCIEVKVFWSVRWFKDGKPWDPDQGVSQKKDVPSPGTVGS